MIRLGTLFPEHLNLNGDQGNLLVIQKRLEAHGVQFETVDFRIGDSLEKLRDIDLLFIGHGSIAAWKALETELARITSPLFDLKSNGGLIFAVSSGAEVLFREPLRMFEGSLMSTPRKSEFMVAPYEGIRVLGYVNSATNLPLIERFGSVLITSFHGPVLAKNPALADLLLQSLGVNSQSNDLLQELDAAVAGVWALEQELANE